MDIKEHFDNAQMRQRTPFTIMPDGSGHWITPEGNMDCQTFDRLYPMGIITTDSGKGENTDRRKNWMDGGKSYR